MYLLRLAAPVLVASVVYLSGALLFSNYNQEAYESMSAYVERLEQNVERLTEHGQELAARAELYRRSTDSVTVAARRLHYYESGQTVIRIEGMDGRAERESPGVILRRPGERRDLMPYVRAAALVAFALTVILQILVFPVARHEMRRASR
jgi:cell division protein FtsB